MRRPLLTALWLACCLCPGGGQRLWFPEGPRPLGLNRVELQGLAARRLELYGVRFDGQRVLLFSGRPLPSGQHQAAWVYIDEDTRGLEAEVTTGSGSGLRLSLPVEPPRFSIGVYGLPGPLALAGPWRALASQEQLRPGDVRVLPPGADPEPLLARAVHVLSAGPSLPAPAQGPDDPWRGRLLPAGGADAPALQRALAEAEAELVEFKRRVEELVPSQGFQGPLLRAASAAQVGPVSLEYPPATPAAVARTLEMQWSRDRVGPARRAALLAASAALVLVAALVRRWALALPLAGAVLAAFLCVSQATAPPLRELAVDFALPAAAQPVRLRPDGPTAERLQLSEQGLGPGRPTLSFRCLLAPGGEAPLQNFLQLQPLRFNQTPIVRSARSARSAGGRMVLAFRNPLSAWSLDEPQ